MNLRRWLLPGLLLALVLFVVIRHLLHPLAPGPTDPVGLLGGGNGPVPVRLRGVLLADPRPAGEPSSPGVAAPCTAVLQLGGGRSELRFPACPELRQGWSLMASGSLRRPRPAPHPLLAGAAERLARQQVWTQLQVEEFTVLRRPGNRAADLRRTIASRLLKVAGPERGGLMAALVLGGARVTLPAEVREVFRAAGLSHALAASGFHLSVLLGAVLALGRRLPRLPRLLLAAGAMGLFLLLAGPQPSVVRAIGMGGLALLVLESGRRGRPLGILVFTVLLMLLGRPAWLQDVGFQLSVAATAGLVLTARPLEQALLARLPGVLGGMPRSWLAPSLAVPLAAAAWTLPLQLLHFGVVPIYAVPANLAAAPLLTPLTLGAMATALVAVLAPPLLPLVAAPVSLLASLLLTVVRGFAALPMAQWQTGRPWPLLVLLLALALLGWLLPGLGRRWRLLGTLLFSLVVSLHLAVLAGDQLLLVHQGGGGGPGGGRDLLVARHRGRGALISSRGDGFSCRQAAQLARGLGIQRFDWLLLLDAVPSAEPDCWRAQAGLVVASGDAGEPLLAGQRLESPGLVAEALSMDSHALRLQVGQQHWLLLPDRQALWAWRDSAEGASGSGASGGGSDAGSEQRLDGAWLGFAPRPREREALQGAGLGRPVWISGPPPRGEPLPHGWLASGSNGALQNGGAGTPAG